MRTGCRIVVGLLLALLLVMQGPVRAQPEPPPPGLGIRLLEVPVAAADDPRANVYIVDHVAPGAVVSRQVEVINGEQERVSVLAYPAAAQVADGAFTAADGRGSNELAAWMTVQPDALDLGPGERGVLQVTIRVPADAADGERFAVVFAERPDAADADGVSIALRAGIRVYLSVGEGPEGTSDFSIQTFVAGRDPAGERVLAAKVLNTGERTLDLTGELVLTSGSLTVGPLDVDEPVTIRPGEATDTTVRLGEEVPAGEWLARLTLRSGLVERSADGVVQVPALSAVVTDGMPDAVAATMVPAPPEVDAAAPRPSRDRGGAVALSLMLLVVVGALLGATYRRRR